MRKGFTLIELLVVITIIGILIGLSIFSLQKARETSRDTKRKADLELIRSGLELYKADCGKYPGSLPSTLKGDDSATSCTSSNTYISSLPKDPLDPSRKYLYSRSSDSTYELCGAQESGGVSLTCGGSSDCGSACNYKVTNP